MFDQDIWCGRTCRAHSQATLTKTEETSEQSWRKLQGWQTQPFLYLDCRKDKNGQPQDAYTEMALAWLGAYTTHSILECHSAGAESLLSQISTDGQHLIASLNVSEKPSNPIPTKLSEVLEPSPDTKYFLSARACQGILNRANRRGKQLPKELQTALERQIARGQVGGDD